MVALKLILVGYLERYDIRNSLITKLSYETESSKMRSHFELLARSWKIFNFIAISLQSMVKFLFFRFQVTNSFLSYEYKVWKKMKKR